jgi:hypothetical protein
MSSAHISTLLFGKQENIWDEHWIHTISLSTASKEKET